MSKIILKNYFVKDRGTVTLRAAMIKDAPAILKMNRDIIKERHYMLHEKDEYKKTISEEENFIRKLNGSTGSIYIVAETKRKVIGYLTFVNSSLKRTKHMGYVGIFIKKKYRNTGIGRILMNELIEWGKQNPSIEKFSLAVFSTNQRAIALYKSVGFKKEGRCLRDLKIDNEYVDQILMYMFV